MSGAEVLVVVGGVAAFAQLLKSAKDIVSWVRSGPAGQQLMVEINDIELRFELLASLHDLKVNLKDAESEVVENAMEGISRHLNDIRQMIDYDHSLQHASRSDRARLAFKQPGRTKKLRTRLISLDRTLELACNILKVRYLAQRTSASNHCATQSDTNSSPIGSERYIPPSKMSLSRFQSQIARSQLRHRSNCSRGTCPCRCHDTSLPTLFQRGRIEGSPWTSLFINCDCSTKEFSWTLAALRYQISVFVSLTYDRGFSLRPTLRVCNTVPNTSPLFVILHKCKLGCMKLDEAISAIQCTISAGCGSFYDVNRDGLNFFEKLLQFPWDFYVREIQFTLLEHFMKDVDVIDSDKLLLNALNWIGEGPHLNVLEMILPSGDSRPLIDPSKSPSALFRHWPSSFNSNWQARSCTPDPYYVEAISLCVNHDPDFGNTSALQYGIHLGATDLVQQLLRKADSRLLTKERNFRQQTALHISVNKPKMVEVLLADGFSEVIDARDRSGTTALMYAAAYGQTSTAVALLRAGANPRLTSDNREHYLYIAMERGHFDFIEDVVNFYIAEGLEDWATMTLNDALHIYIWAPISIMADPDFSWFQRLLVLGARPTWANELGNTLFHVVDRVEQASLLLDFASPPADCENKFGRTPLMALSTLLDLNIVRRLIATGASITQQDHFGWTVFEHVLQAATSACFSILCFESCAKTSWNHTCEIMFELLQDGVDFGSTDHCICACSPHGCTALRFWLPGICSTSDRKHNLYWMPWIIECFLMLRVLHKKGLQKFIAALARRQRFDEIGLKHTCCLSRQKPFFGSVSSPRTTADCEKSCKGGHNRASHIDDEERRELQEEQEELIVQLEEFCNGFHKPENPVTTNHELALITTLARRVVFIERGLAEVRSKVEAVRNRNRTRKSRHSNNTYRYSDKIEILSSESVYDPVVIDYGYDEFTHLTSPTYPEFSLGDEFAIPHAEDVVENYLQVTEHLNYQSLPSIDSEKIRGLHQERHRLSKLLIQEIQNVRGISDEKADWDLDIVNSYT